MGGRLEGRLASGVSGEIGYYRSFVSGGTPFEFDDVDLPNEARLGLAGRLSRKWGAGGAVRLDMERGRTFDTALWLESIQHCLAYRLTWQERRGTLEIGVRLVPEAEAP